MKLGAYAGLAGGVVFGAMMAVMGTLSMVGRMVGDSSAETGFLIHLFISAVIGVGFSALFRNLVQSLSSALSYGLLYGGAWWFLGPLTLMPFITGMGLGVNWSASVATEMLSSFVGHLVYGTILGISYMWFRRRSNAHEAAGVQMRTLAELCMYNTLSKEADLRREDR
jgi:uncharacterized membrane protein YagU involved in acid resistance